MLESEPEPEKILPEDMDKLNAIIKELDLENSQLKLKLNQVKQNNEDLKGERKEMKEKFTNNKKRVREENRKKECVGDDLVGANFELTNKSKELEPAKRSIQNLKKTVDQATKMKK